MSYVPGVKVNSPLSSTVSKIRNAITNNTLAHSPDFLLSGRSLKLNSKHKYPLGIGVQYTTASYDFSASYDPNTLISVTGSDFGQAPGSYINTESIASLYYYNALVTAGISTSGSDYAIYVRNPAKSYIPNPSIANSVWKQLQAGGVSVTWMAYNETVAIPKGTEVWVDPNGNFSRSLFTTGSDGGPPLCAGSFIALVDIPAAVSGSRPAGNWWFPFYPPLPDSAQTTVSGSVYNQNPFGAITPLQPVQACINNQTVTGFGIFIQSGSTYVFALPHP